MGLTPTKYEIELRDKNGNLKRYLTPFVGKVSWEWNRIGGCGNASLILHKGYRDIIFDARDDIQIRIKDGSSSKLVYRGYIADIVPTLQADQNIKLNIKGYFDLLKKIIVQDSGDYQTYIAQEISVIVNDIVDTFVTPNSPITKGTIDVGEFEADEIQFLGTVENALNTLAQLSGDIEYGVDENLEFFWRIESTEIRHKFFVGNNVQMLERRINYDDLVNKIYLIGGKEEGVTYKRIAENTDSQNQYYLSEKVESNSSIITDTVADQYLGAILQEKANPQFKIRAKITNTSLRLEDIIPIGLITFYDAQYDKSSGGDSIGDIIGEAADGGSDITIGLTEDGGDNVTIGGQFSAQVDRLSYELSDTEGRMNLTIQFGDTILETAAKIKKLELALSDLQQD